jgi:hypothetical protein
LIAGQLALDLDAAMPTRVAMEDDILARLRAQVVEADMSPDEAEAAVADAHRRLGLGPVEATQAPRCICERPQVFVDAFADERRCNLCGREPRR